MRKTMMMMNNLFLLALVKKKELVKRTDMKAADEDSYEKKV